MKVLISKEPKLDIETNRDLLKDLEATVVPSRAKPGTAKGADRRSGGVAGFNVRLPLG